MSIYVIHHIFVWITPILDRVYQGLRQLSSSSRRYLSTYFPLKSSENWAVGFTTVCAQVFCT